MAPASILQIILQYSCDLCVTVPRRTFGLGVCVRDGLACYYNTEVKTNPFAFPSGFVDNMAHEEWSRRKF